MFSRGVVDEVRAALADAGLANRQEDTRPPRDRELEAAEALERIVVRTRRYAAYQRKWMWRIPGIVLVDGHAAVRGLVDEIARARPAVASAAMRFEKWHALGNAYVLVEQPDAGAMTPRVSRDSAIPAPGSGATACWRSPSATDARASGRIWNPDGSTAEMSGNGTRIAAAWLLRETGADEVEIVTAGRRVRADRRYRRARPSGARRGQGLGGRGARRRRRAALDRPRRRRQPARRRPPRARCRGTTCFASAPRSRRIRGFADRTNVQLARPEPRDVVSVLVWERGAGETAASGSSAAAVAAAAVARGWCDSPVRVAMPGGELVVAIKGGAGVARRARRSRSARGRRRL